MTNLFKILIVLTLFVAFDLQAQSVDATRIKKKVNGGIVGDSSNALAVGAYRGTTAPTSPVSGQLWMDTTTTPAILKAWNGSTWEISPTAAGITQEDLTSFPANPTDGQIVWLRKERRSIIYDMTADGWFYLDGINKRASTSYSLAVAGYPSDFITPPSTALTLATGTGASTAGSHVCAVTFFNSTGGETTPGPLSNSVTTTAGLGYAFTDVPLGGTGTVGRRIYCSKANTISPVFLVARIEDNTTTTGSATGADTTFYHTPPDVNYSASIPAGWSVWLPPNTGYQYGGCGSTGSSLLCMVTGKAPASASGSGVRLTYYVTDASDYWRAQFKVIRSNSGFEGNAAANFSGFAAFIATKTNDAAAVATTAITGLSNHLGASPAVRVVRPSGLAYGNPAAAAAIATYRMTDYVPPRWVAYTQAGSDSNWYLSGNGKDWNTPYSYISNADYIMRHVGIAGESITGASATLSQGVLVEITDFTVESWP